MVVNENSNSSDGTALNKTHEEMREEGEEAGESEEEETNTADNAGQNSVEDNKKLSEVTMAEQIRKTFNLTLKIPRILQGLHTNQFFFIQVSDHFYETNYPEIISVIADKKFGRFAGFKKGRFFVEKVVEKGGMDGWSTEITLNPIPPSLAIYSQKQKEAQKALMHAVKWEMGGGGGGLTQTNGSDCTDVYGISTRNHDINETANNIIGNSSANYATDTASMDGKQALLDIRKRFQYSSYQNNATCPQEMWNADGSISGNCADISRLCMCVGQVHGLKIGIHHMSGHYYNLIEVNGQTYRFDCCCQYSGQYGGETTNTLTMNGGPWSGG